MWKEGFFFLFLFFYFFLFFPSLCLSLTLSVRVRVNGPLVLFPSLATVQGTVFSESWNNYSVMVDIQELDQYTGGGIGGVYYGCFDRNLSSVVLSAYDMYGTRIMTVVSLENAFFM